MNKQLNELIQRLLFGRAQFHAWHLTTTSYARHKAFETIYEFLGEHADTLAEAVQDNNRFIMDGTFTFDADENEAESKLRTLGRFCQDIYIEHDECPEYICNMLQELERDLHKGLYLLSLE